MRFKLEPDQQFRLETIDGDQYINIDPVSPVGYGVGLDGDIRSYPLTDNDNPQFLFPTLAYAESAYIMSLLLRDKEAMDYERVNSEWAYMLSKIVVENDVFTVKNSDSKNGLLVFNSNKAARAFLEKHIERLERCKCWF